MSLFLFEDFNLYPFTVRNQNREYTRFAEFCESSGITEPEGALGDPQTIPPIALPTLRTTNSEAEGWRADTPSASHHI